MATKKVNLVISLKDNVSGGLGKIRSGLASTRKGLNSLAIAGVAMATAVIGGLTALAKAYAEQETVNNKLKATFDAAGESGAAAVQKWGEWATSIQRVTTLSDEEVMNLVSLAKTMGVTNDKIADATKGAIGLSKAFGIDMTASMKMVALAQQGEFEMLARYIPALRQATTEAEKQDIVNRAMANGFKVAEAELDTLGGAFTAFKGVVGDAMQLAGESLFGDGGLTQGLTNLKEKIIEITEGGELEYWGAEVKEVFETLKPVIEGVTWVLEKALEGWQAIFGTLNKVGAFLGNFAGAIGAGESVGDAFSESKDVAKNYSKNREERKKTFIKNLREEEKETVKSLKKMQDSAKANAPVPWYKDPKSDGVVGKAAEELAKAGKKKKTTIKAGAGAISSKLNVGAPSGDSFEGESSGGGGRGPRIKEHGSFSLIGARRSFSDSAGELSNVSKKTEGESAKLLTNLAEERNKILEQIAKTVGGVSEG